MLTYLDSNVLIVAAKAPWSRSGAVWSILADDSRSFGSSRYSQLEVLPKVLAENWVGQLGFLQDFYSRVSVWASPNEEIVETAYEIAMADGINAMDALHLASALQIGADEFVTAENPRKSRLARTTRLPIRLI